MSFSSLDRNEHLEKLQNNTFDVLIIGGGITGCGIALDAASRGLKVALIEKNDFAYGTSGRSTKLIHGGLRYLKQFEFGLVKEVGSERAIVHKLAPHLVVPEKMLLPLTARSLGATLTSIGLKIYDWLAGVKREDRRKMLTRPQTLRREPLLKKKGVKGGALYAEYRTDDARLTIEIAKTAAMHGALLINYCKALKLTYSNHQLNGVIAKDQLTGQEISIKARVTVSATGPWVDELRELDKSKTKRRLHLTKGVHLVVSYERLPVQQAIYFDVEDGRMIFAIPRGPTTYIGTTDTNYEGNLDNVSTSIDDAKYLINAVNDAFPSVKLNLSDIDSSWAGLRPLIHEEGKSATELSRKDEIFESPTGLISIAGGKLTGYRKMAERVVDLVIEKYFENRDLKSCHTDKIKLTGSGFGNYDEVKNYIGALRIRLERYGLQPELAAYLVGNYGKQTEVILSGYEGFDNKGDGDLAAAELLFCIKNEMVHLPEDFCVRRSGMIYFNKSRLVDVLDMLVSQCKRSFKWDDAQASHEAEKMKNLVEKTTKFA
jgi:glycerol-3-phosphate dehydrogenase